MFAFGLEMWMQIRGVAIHFNNSLWFVIADTARSLFWFIFNDAIH